MNPERISRQIKLAEEVLAAWVKKLEADKVSPDQFRKNAKWRHLDGDLRALKRRAIAAKEILDREAAILAGKAEAAAAE